MPYDSSTGIITAPLNTSDILNAIGENSHGVKNLATSSKINPDSLIKPIPVTSPAVNPWYDFATQGDFNKPTEDNNYLYLAGYKIPKVTTLTAANIVAKLQDKTWIRQTVDTANPGSMGHFIGYNSKVRFEDAPWPIVYSKIEVGSPIHITLYGSLSGNKYLVSPVNMQFFLNKYWGVAVFRQPVNSTQTWSLIEAKTCSDPITMSNQTIDGDPLSYPSRKIIVFPNAEADSLYLIIPFISPVAFTTMTDMYKAGVLYCAAYKAPSVYSAIGASGGLIRTGAAANSVIIDAYASLGGGIIGTDMLEVTVTGTSTFASAITIYGKLQYVSYDSSGNVTASWEEEIFPLGKSLPAASPTSPQSFTENALTTVREKPWDTVSVTFSGYYTAGSTTYPLQSAVKYLNANGGANPPVVH